MVQMQHNAVSAPNATTRGYAEPKKTSTPSRSRRRKSRCDNALLAQNRLTQAGIDIPELTPPQATIFFSTAYSKLCAEEQKYMQAFCTRDKGPKSLWEKVKRIAGSHKMGEKEKIKAVSRHMESVLEGFHAGINFVALEMVEAKAQGKDLLPAD